MPLLRERIFCLRDPRRQVLLLSSRLYGTAYLTKLAKQPITLQPVRLSHLIDVRINGRFLFLHDQLLSCQAPKQECTEHDKKNVRKPNEQLRVHFRVSAQRVADDDEEEIADGHDQAHGETNRWL